MIYNKVSSIKLFMKKSNFRRLFLKCNSCYRRMFASRPFITKEWQGLESRPCKCKNNSESCAVFKPRGKEAIESWKRLLHGWEE